MFKSSSNIIKQVCQRGAICAAPSAQPSRLLSTSTIRLAENEEAPAETRQSRMQKLLLEIPPEYNIPGMSKCPLHLGYRTRVYEPKQTDPQKPPRDERRRAPYHPNRRISETVTINSAQQSRLQNTGQPFPRPPRRSTTDAYSLLQNMPLPPRNKPSHSSESSKRQNEEGKERRPRAERGERSERSAQGGPRGDNRREPRQPRQNDREGAVRAEAARGGKERAPRRDAERATSGPPAPRRQEQKPEIVQRAAPTVEELFGDSSMFGEQRSVVSEVFEGIEEAPASKSTYPTICIFLRSAHSFLFRRPKSHQP